MTVTLPGLEELLKAHGLRVVKFENNSRNLGHTPERVLLALINGDAEEPASPMTYPEEMSADLREALGWPNFACYAMAALAREAGQAVPHHAEDEQAFAIHFAVKMILRHGAGWRAEATAECRRWKEEAFRRIDEDEERRVAGGPAAR